MSPEDLRKEQTELLPLVSLSLPTSDSYVLSEDELKSHEHNESNTTDSSSTDTVIRRTTSWRWVIVLASFCAHFVADGILFSFGVLMHVMKEDLNVELHEVGVIASLFVSLPLFLAPVSSALVNKFGCRFVTILGGVLCSIGTLIASLSGNYMGSVIGIGVLSGAGLSCVYVPAVVIIAHYFDENRAIATALAVGGTGLGNAVIAQLIHFLNHYYDDWRNTTFVLSSVFLTIIACGILFRPVEFSLRHSSTHDNNRTVDNCLPETCGASSEKLQRFMNDVDKQPQSSPQVLTVDETIPSHETKGVNALNTYEEVDTKVGERGFIQEMIPNVIKRRLSIENTRHYNRPVLRRNSRRYFSANLLDPLSVDQQLLEVFRQPISQKDIFYPGNVPAKLVHVSRKSCPDLLESYVYEEPATSPSDDECSSVSTRRSRIPIHLRALTFLHTLRRMFGLQLLLDYQYLLFFISQFLFYFFYDLIYLFPVDYGEKLVGYSKEQMTMLVTILGFGQFFGQIMYGALANYTPIDALVFYDIGALLCGISSLLIPFVVDSYIALAAVILLFGLSISANYALTSVILASMCGLEMLTSAYGLVLLGQGLSSLFGPVVGGFMSLSLLCKTLLGWIAERYGYKASLIVAGIFMSSSGLATILIPILRRVRGNRTEASNEKMTTTTATLTSSDTCA